MFPAPILIFSFLKENICYLFCASTLHGDKESCKGRKGYSEVDSTKEKKIIATCIIFMQVVHSTSDDSQMETSRSFAFRLLWWCGKGDLNWVIVVFINYRLNIPFLKCWGSNVFQISKSFKFGIMRYPGKYALVFHI